MRRNLLKAVVSLILVIILCTTCVVPFTAAQGDVAVQPIDFNNPDFIRGMDISSVIALEQSGVVFRDENGNQDDIFKILADNGVNTIRVRVWYDPYSSDGRGYGGGNNDVGTAVQIGKRAAKYGMKLLVDFHYSDFWADPGKQKAPKLWSGMSVGDKCDALYEYTLGCLRTLRNEGANIGMVQIGNETTLGIAGENSWQNMTTLYNAGSRAVRDFSSDVKVVIHYTNPENSYIKTLADFLHNYHVDYDVFATSYYPCWHGSLSNLTEVLNYAAKKYGKYAMVAETSYPYTLSDSDGHPNTISEWNNNAGENMLWDFTPQGQANEVRAVMNAVNDVEDGKGLGMFYWEGAWITVGDVTGLSGDAYTKQLAHNKLLWERDGSGWAASACAEYDPDDAGKWYGGSAVDNQAFFLPDGTALPSLHVFKDVLGDGSYRLGDADGSGEIDITDATCIQRSCAMMQTRIDERILLHGDIDGDGLSVMDATMIQRHLLGATLPYPVGVWRQEEK
jgi:arabinogalactan endo-1,4-beta-galactosidase